MYADGDEEEINERTRLIPALPNTNLVYTDSHGDTSSASTEIMAEPAISPNTASKLPQYVAALAATGGALASGTILGWTSPASPRLIDDQEYDFTVNSDQFSWIGASMNLGAAAVCFPIALLMKQIGRKWSMLFLVIPFTIGWSLLIWAQNLSMMYIGRTFLGIAGGAFCVTAPAYTGEIAQDNVRGTLGSFFQLMVTIGILFSYGIGATVSLFTLSILCGIIPLVFGAVFFFMPESPTYLVEKGKKDSALSSIKWLRGKNYNAESELELLQSQCDERKALNTSFRDGFTRPATVRALIIATGLMFFQQLSGINAVIFYTTDIFSAASTDLDPEVATIIVGVIQVIATVVSALVVDKVGRRILLLISDTCMAICTILLGVYFFLKDKDEENVDNLGWLPIVSLCIFIVAFSLGFGPVPWLMVGELFDVDVKGIGSSIVGVTNWLLSFLVTKFFTNLRDGMGTGETFWLFSGISILGTVFVFFLVPETKGKSLPDIQKMLAGEKVQTPRNTDAEIVGSK